MRQRWRRNEKRKGEGCGNDGAVESVESRKQASHSFHEPLGNLANSRRDSHISTAPAAKADGKVENQHQVFHFPTATISLMSKKEKPKARAGFALRVRGGAPRRLSIKRQLSLIGRNSCRRPKEIVDAGHTLAYYEVQVGHLMSYAALANAPVDAVPPAVISGFVAK